MSDEARRQAQAMLQQTRQHLTSLVEQHTRAYSVWLDLCERTLKGEASFDDVVETSLSLTQEYFAKLSSCVGTANLLAGDQFDQMSEAAGPHVMAAGGAALARVAKLPPVKFRGPGSSSVDSQNVLIRQLADGSLHVTLTALDETLPDGTYVADVQPQSAGVAPTPFTELSATKTTRPRAPLAIGFGDDVPSYLKSDPQLDLVKLLFE